jgi:hypothetical protein
MSKKEAKRTGRKILKPILNWLWNLVDALTPPWIRSLGIFSSLIWIWCVSFGGSLVNPSDNTTQTMALIFDDATWGFVSFLVCVVCAWSITDYSNLQKRFVALNVLLGYWGLTWFLINVGRWNRPLGWFHFMFATFAAIAIFRPLLLGVIKRWKTRVHLGD